MYKNIILVEDFKIELKNLLSEDNNISDEIDGRLDFDNHFEKPSSSETTSATKVIPPEVDPSLDKTPGLNKIAPTDDLDPILKKTTDNKYLLHELEEEVDDDDEDDTDLEDTDYLSIGGDLDDEDDEEDFDGDGEDDIDPDELDNMTLGFDDEVSELADDEAIDDAEDKNIKSVIKEEMSIVDQLIELEEDGKDIEDEDLDDDDLDSGIDDEDADDDDLKAIDDDALKTEDTMLSFLEELELDEVLDEHVESDGYKRRQNREIAKSKNVTSTEESDESIKTEEMDTFLEGLELDEI